MIAFWALSIARGVFDLRGVLHVGCAPFFRILFLKLYSGMLKSTGEVVIGPRRRLVWQQETVRMGNG
jgi:hypothetical protein